MDTDQNRDSFEKLEEEIIGIHDYYMPDDYAGDNIAQDLIDMTQPFIQMQQDTGALERASQVLLDRESPYRINNREQPLTTPDRQSKNSVITHSSQNFQTTQASNLKYGFNALDIDRQNLESVFKSVARESTVSAGLVSLIGGADFCS